MTNQQYFDILLVVLFLTVAFRAYLHIRDKDGGWW